VTLYGVDMDYGRVELKSVEVTRESKLYYFVERGTAITDYSRRISKAAVTNGVRGIAATPDEAWALAEARVRNRLAAAECAVEVYRAAFDKFMECRPAR